MYIFVVGGDGSKKKTFVVDQDVPFRVHSYLFTKHPLCLKNPPHRPTPVLHLRIPIYSKMHQIKPQQTIIKITNKSLFPVGDILRLHLAWTKSGILRLQSWSPAFRPTAGHHTRADLCWYIMIINTKKVQYKPRLSISNSSLLKSLLPQLGSSVHLPKRLQQLKISSTSCTKPASLMSSMSIPCSVVISSRRHSRPVITVSVMRSQQS